MNDNTGPVQVSFASCYAEFTGEMLAIGNASIERRWRVENGLLYAVSLLDRTSGLEWIGEPSPVPAPLPPTVLPAEDRAVAFTAEGGTWGPTEEPSLHAELSAVGVSGTLCYRFQVFPDSASVTMQLVSDMADEGTVDTSPGVETILDCLEHFPLGQRHACLTQVSLVDRTDAYNELVHEQLWLLNPRETIRASGNLFILEDTFTGAGLILLKLAPLPHARSISNEVDLEVHGLDTLTCLGHGIGDGVAEGYRWATITYQGGSTGATAALHRYQRQRRTYQPGRDGLFLSNTWGDRSGNTNVNESFLLREIEAAAKLGVEVLQIDEGWQQGRTPYDAGAAGILEGFWAVDPHFWQVDATRFPQGLAPLVEAAARYGIKVGLWFVPDSADSLANWESDAALLLDFHRTQGLCYFKIDSMDMTTRRGEVNGRQLFSSLLRQSEGRIVCDLDVTAGTRAGYFGIMETGPIFVENRYTDWQCYWPHYTLRNIWQLARYIDPVHLRMELLNNTRNSEGRLYKDDPLAPARYRPSYLFAITMMTSPLGWFEMSNLPQEYIAEVAPLVACWKEHRDRLHAGTIFPIGACPNGVSWTGFLSVDDQRAHGYLLLFRELNDRPHWETTLPDMPGNYRCITLAGAGKATLTDGRLAINIPAPQQFAFIELTCE